MFGSLCRHLYRGVGERERDRKTVLVLLRNCFMEDARNHRVSRRELPCAVVLPLRPTKLGRNSDGRSSLSCGITTNVVMLEFLKSYQWAKCVTSSCSAPACFERHTNLGCGHELGERRRQSWNKALSKVCLLLEVVESPHNGGQKSKLLVRALLARSAVIVRR